MTSKYSDITTDELLGLKKHVPEITMKLVSLLLQIPLNPLNLNLIEQLQVIVIFL